MGPLLRVLLIFLGVGLALLVLRQILFQRRGPRKADSARVQPMVPCDYCGVHIPETEALQAGARRYCSESHRQAHNPR